MKKSTLKNFHRAFTLVTCTGIVAGGIAGFRPIKTAAEIQGLQIEQEKILNVFKESEGFQNYYETEYQRLLEHAASSKMPLDELNAKANALSSAESTLAYFRATSDKATVETYDALEEQETKLNKTAEKKFKDFIAVAGTSFVVAGGFGIADICLDSKKRKEDAQAESNEESKTEQLEFSPEVLEKLKDLDEKTNYNSREM